jgi:DNA-binding beta-propeller fold protein YncE
MLIEYNMGKLKSLKKIVLFIFIFLLSFGSFAPSVMAADDMDYVTANSSFRLPIPKAYNAVGTINNLGTLGEPWEKEKVFFKDPQDIFIDKNDNVYIMDTGNNRIVVMNKDLKTIGVYRSPDVLDFSSPEGLFVDDDGDIYVADTGNSRIVHLSNTGELVEIFYNPDSELISGNPFSPSKLIVSKTGYIYVVRGENIMAIDGNNGFRGLFGQTDIGYNLAEALTRMFASDFQKLSMKRRTASSYMNITLGEDGMIYATSLERIEGEIKKLNSVGNNIYRKYRSIGSGFTNPITNYIRTKILKSVVAGNSFKFGEYFDDEGYYMEPIFRDVAVDSNGILTTIEENTGKLYQYDQEGNMLAAFGGIGEKSGEFSRPSGIAVNSKGIIYVVDRLNNNIQYFEPTEFILTVQEATTSYDKGNYDLAFDRWSKVLELHENYELAHAGLAKAYYKQEKWELSMRESKLAGNRDIYTQAFDEYKYQVLRENFAPIVALALVVLLLIFLFLKYSIRSGVKANWSFISEHHRKMGLWQGIKYSYNVMLHPIDTIEGVHYYKTRINLKSSLCILLVAYIVRIAYMYIVHYPLASIEVNEANAVFEAVKLFIVPLTFIPAAFAVTSISDGESKFPEIAFTSILGLVPYIVINTPLMFLSNLLSKSQQSWYGVFNVIVYIWMVIILFLSMKILNNYTFGKTIRMCIIAIFVMLIIWLVAGMFYVLSARVIQFIISVIQEFNVNFL